ncbi:MAG: hypothetical protein QG673_2285, partial [Pseudomonadota bacterium]|nr:hypothetical protein [Pseudomonadota bacterium]
MKIIKNISLFTIMAIMATLFGCSSGNSNKSNPNPQSYLSQPTGNYTSTCTNVYWYGESGFLSGLCQTESNGFI